LIDPAFDQIRRDPRYVALVVRFGFTPSAIQKVERTIKSGGELSESTDAI